MKENTLRLPENLEPETLAYINDVVKHLKDSDSYNKIDNGALHMLCVSFNTYIKAAKQIEEEGLTVVSDRGNVAAHPAYNIMKTSIANAMAIVRDFGLSLKSRERLSIMSNETSESPLAAFLSQKG